VLLAVEGIDAAASGEMAIEGTMPAWVMVSVCESEGSVVETTVTVAVRAASSVFSRMLSLTSPTPVTGAAGAVTLIHPAGPEAICTDAVHSTLAVTAIV